MRVIKFVSAVLSALVVTIICVAAPFMNVSCVHEVSTGLISKCVLKCNYDNSRPGIISITAKTQAMGVMRRVCIRNIVIQRVNNNGSYAESYVVDDVVNRSARYSYLDNYDVEVPAGLYEVSCEHFAEGSTILCDDAAQSVYNSTTVLVEEGAAPTEPPTTASTTVTTTTRPRTTTTTTVSVRRSNVTTTAAVRKNSAVTTAAGTTVLNASGNGSGSSSASQAGTAGSASQTTAASSAGTSPAESPRTGRSAAAFLAALAASISAAVISGKRRRS
ncbi:MAG TPA: hypothetical protein DCZ71_07620 [Ruminococcus sp.]|nr:hypothetical protein [Ruminococcus sp.]